MLKKLISLLFVALFLFLSLGLCAFAADLETPAENDVEIVDYETIGGYSLSLTSLNKKANIAIRVYGNNSQFRSGTLKLFKYEKGVWTAVKTWTNLSSLTNTFMFTDNSVAVQSGTKYKIKIAITAYTGNKSEKIVLDMTKEL